MNSQTRTRFAPASTLLSPDRAFVVQLRDGLAQKSAVIAGRVEHVTSGRAAFFSSLNELSEFMHSSPHSMLGHAGSTRTSATKRS